MKKENKLINKVKRLLKNAGCPRWLHHYGPKKFVLWQLMLGLLIKEVFRLSYRRAMKFLAEYYNLQLHWTTLQKFRKRVPLGLWKRLLASTYPSPTVLGAIDGTSFQRSNPSAHYLKRIDRTQKIAVPVYLNFFVDIQQRKFLAVRHHVRRRGEIRDVPYLLKQRRYEVKVLLMDKLYDSEKLHRFLRSKGVLSIAPVKKNYARGSIRKQLKEHFDKRLYNQRNIIEALFSALKRVFGSTLMSRKAKTQRAEISMKIIAYNIGKRINEIFY
jgi:transposase